MKITLDTVKLTYPDDAVGYYRVAVADDAGDHYLLTNEEYHNLTFSLNQQQTDIEKLKTQLKDTKRAILRIIDTLNRLTDSTTKAYNNSNEEANELHNKLQQMQKSLRACCLETETPIYF